MYLYQIYVFGFFYWWDWYMIKDPSKTPQCSKQCRMTTETRTHNMFTAISLYTMQTSKHSISDIMLKWRSPFKPMVSCNRKKSHRLYLLFPLIIKFFFFNFKAKPSPSLLTFGLLCTWTPPESWKGKQLQWESWSGRNNQLPATQRPHSWQPDTV